jgi:hypothetical protein
MFEVCYADVSGNAVRCVARDWAKACEIAKRAVRNREKHVVIRRVRAKFAIVDDGLLVNVYLVDPVHRKRMMTACEVQLERGLHWVSEYLAIDQERSILIQPTKEEPKNRRKIG